MELQDWLSDGAIAVDVGAGGKRAALNAAAELAARAYGLDAAAVFEALVEREAHGSTGVGHGVAVPHAQLPGLDRMRAVFVRLDDAAPFGAVDDRPVDILFALLAPVGAGSEHLRALARVSRQLRRPELRERLRLARTPDAVRALLADERQPSAA